jgi:predicted amidophosphoribosyltransferase
MSLCPNCGSQQPDGAAFCDECGAKLELVPMPPAAAMPQSSPAARVGMNCPVCGAPVTPGETFCDNCGAALGPAAPVAAPPYPTVPASAPPAAGPGPAQYPTIPAPPPSATVPSPGQARAPRASAPQAEAPQARSPICHNCGAQLEPGSNFCDMCGAPAHAVAPPPASSPPPQPVPAPATAPSSAGAHPPPPAQYAPTAVSPPPAYPPEGGIQGRFVVQGTGATIPFPPGRTEVVIGREDPVSSVFPEIDLTDHGGDEGGVSRQHARIFVQSGQIFIEDLNSTNYTHVNQQKLTPGQPHPLRDGDEVRFGRVKMNYYSA